MMEQAPFYRTDLNGRKIPVSFNELHPVLRDIVHYFEVNLNEPQNVMVMAEYSKLEYWKYLSIGWTEPEIAESKRYTWLCERGCLALLNGLSLDFLTERAPSCHSCFVREWIGPVVTPALDASNLNALRNGKRILQVHTEVANGAVHLGMTKQQLDSAEIACLLIDVSNLGTPHGVGAIGTRP
jgi:hypothetical protein